MSSLISYIPALSTRFLLDLNFQIFLQNHNLLEFWNNNINGKDETLMVPVRCLEFYVQLSTR